MKKILVQIYEIQTPQEAEEMAALGVDTAGSVITSVDDWKNESILKTVQTAKKHNINTSIIPLFSDEEAVFRVVDYYEPHIIHFCESLVDSRGRAIDLEKYIRLQTNVKKRFPGLKIMRSIPIARPGLGHLAPTLKIAEAMEPLSDIFLTDTWLGGDGDGPSDPVEGFIGITGLLCDGDLAARLVNQSKIPVILAGGISPDNVFESLLAVRPAGVDSCTRTNAVDNKGVSIRFKKDPDKVRLLVLETRRAEIEINRK